jgi:hypothetical protein
MVTHRIRSGRLLRFNAKFGQWTHERGAGSLAGAMPLDYAFALIDQSFDDNDG